MSEYVINDPQEAYRCLDMGRAYHEMGLTEDDVRVKTAGMDDGLRLIVNQGWWRAFVDSKRSYFKHRGEERE